MSQQARRSLIIKRGSRERFPTTMTVDVSQDEPFIKTTQLNIDARHVADSIGREPSEFPRHWTDRKHVTGDV